MNPQPAYPHALARVASDLSPVAQALVLEALGGDEAYRILGPDQIVDGESRPAMLREAVARGEHDDHPAAHAEDDTRRWLAGLDESTARGCARVRLLLVAALAQRLGARSTPAALRAVTPGGAAAVARICDLEQRLETEILVRLRRVALA